MDRTDLIDDPRCRDNTLRVANRVLVNGAIETWLGTLPGTAAADAILRENHIPHAPVLTVEEAMAHPHLRERRTVRMVHDRILGEFQVPGFPLRFSGFPEELPLEAPLLGEHNRRILKDYLGLSGDRIEQLERAGVLHSAPY
jgi:crotonobetainyl-CoA:carnitine CoA-transferase CaiB-like acyl-CoA transferase